MEWCLACHRDPVKNLRPREAVTVMGWEAPENLPELQRELARRVQRQEQDELLDLPPVMSAGARGPREMSDSAVHDPASGERCHAEATRPAPGAAALDLAAVRERLAGARGPAYWRSLEEVAGTPEFEEMLHREFPRFASEWPQGTSRRNFLQLAAASLALAGLTACTRQPLEKIVPYVRQPEEIVPGRPLHFATAMPLGGFATGVLVESHTGRPTKVEGNPEHPASLGAQRRARRRRRSSASTIPTAPRPITRLGRISTWGELLKELAAVILAQRALGGGGLRLLTGAVTSPTLAAADPALLAELPQARWHQWEPLGREASGRGARLAFGAPTGVRFDLAPADVVLAAGERLPRLRPRVGPLRPRLRRRAAGWPRARRR